MHHPTNATAPPPPAAVTAAPLHHHRLHHDHQPISLQPYGCAVFVLAEKHHNGAFGWTNSTTSAFGVWSALKNTKDMVLVYGGKLETELKVTCYIDAVEYIAAGEASMEAIQMRKFIDGLRNVVPTNKRPLEMLCDNMPAIAIGNDLGIMKGERLYQRKYHYIRKVIQDGEIVIKKVHIDDNIADLLMKPMPYTKHF
ncbi:hypothetical protein Tco_1081493 [Tanacetum coccineum]|uniref:Uncharacterized protein n=1 Tax=Tanacetum coccineum TaxID=301880 RepID=A0ABQ5HZQ2_9ASTR